MLDEETEQVVLGYVEADRSGREAGVDKLGQELTCCIILHGGLHANMDIERGNPHVCMAC